LLWLLARRKKTLLRPLRHRLLKLRLLLRQLRLTQPHRPLTRLLLTLLLRLPLRLLRLLQKPLRLLLLRLLRSNQLFLIKKTGLRAGFFTSVRFAFALIDYRRPRAGGDPISLIEVANACAVTAHGNWIPACAGTTFSL
jgi:hypothetical protein